MLGNLVNNKTESNLGFSINKTDVGLSVNQYINATCTLNFRGGILTNRSVGC
jgi:hypothetical protein